MYESKDEAQARLKQDLTNWDGFAERESVGFDVLVEFRKLLLDRVISPFVAKCREYDPKFRFGSTMIDVPLQQLLEARQPSLLPDKIHYPDWDSFLLDLLMQAHRKVSTYRSDDTPDGVAWGEVNQVAIAHPFSETLPLLRRWLDMPHAALPGCGECVRMHESGFGASERLVVSPGHEGNGILHMPGGQSGHPLSSHYRDQQRAWVEGAVIPLETAKTVHRIEFEPAPLQLEQNWSH